MNLATYVVLIVAFTCLACFYAGTVVGRYMAAQRIVNRVLARETRLESLAEDSGVLEPDGRP